MVTVMVMVIKVGSVDGNVTSLTWILDLGQFF